MPIRLPRAIVNAGFQMDIIKIFESKSRQLFWRAMDPAHLVGVPAPRSIDAGKAYYSIRLCEMYLAAARKLWRQIYPMVHCYTRAGATESHAIASPGQLSDLGDANLDRIANLNLRLSGPTPCKGEEMSLLVGLYAIPSHDSAKALIDVVSAFAALDPTAIGKAVSLSGLVKNGVESILGLDQATLHFGVRDSFNPASRPLQSGYFAGIAAPDQTIDISQLWVVGGRLQKGKDAASSVPYSDHDYMLLAIERVDERDDWPQLVELQEVLKKFSSLIADSQFAVDEKRTRLAALWPVFIQALADSPNLTEPDRDRIASLVSGDLLKKLKMQEEANPFLHAA